MSEILDTVQRHILPRIPAGKMGRAILAITLAMAAGLAAAPPEAVVRGTPEAVGAKAYALLDSTAGEVFLLNFTQLWVNYRGGVDFQLRAEGVLMTPGNAELLYSKAAVPAPRHLPGSRPRLEAVVAKVTRGCRGRQAQALAIMRFCRDLYQKKPYPVEWDKYVFGGTEEQLVEKGEILCEALGRLQVALCEVAGIPARLVMHLAGGHITAEVYTEHGWGWLDPRMGIYFLDKAGALASVRTLLRHPELMAHQGDAVKADTVAYMDWEERANACRTRYFHPLELILFEYYSLADAPLYQYHQLTRQETLDAGLREINRKYVKAINAFLAQPGNPERWR